MTKRDLFLRNSDYTSVWRYREALPFPSRVKPVTLGEGGTPLVRSRRLSEELDLPKLFIKNEGQNPTGSFKDRGMTVSVTRAVESGAKILICASTGNTSASLAAYAARAGVKAAVVVPSGKVAGGKLAQAVAYGAAILRIDGNFDRALNLTVETVSELPNLYLMNSVNPYRIEGQKTVAFEIYQQLDFVCPDYVVLPVGNAGNISAVWKGFRELKEWGMTRKLPVLVGVQASGASPIVDAYQRGSQEISPVDEPKTVASAIRIGNPVSWRKAANALMESGGMAIAVSDEEIIQAREDLASEEGIFVEPASATPIAALRRLGGKVKKGSTVVCIATGHGLKDQDSVHWNAEESPVIVDKSSLKSELGKLRIN